MIYCQLLSGLKDELVKKSKNFDEGYRLYRTADTKRGGSIVGGALNFFRTLIQLDAVTRMLQLTKIPAAGFMLGFLRIIFLSLKVYSYGVKKECPLGLAVAGFCGVNNKSDCKNNSFVGIRCCQPQR